MVGVRLFAHGPAVRLDGERADKVGAALALLLATEVVIRLRMKLWSE